MTSKKEWLTHEKYDCIWVAMCANQLVADALVNLLNQENLGAIKALAQKATIKLN
jgi:hypothetical protein